ncbi:hypothetical protein DPMN_068163 [Dreissena polymorpha]|uniref:Uncharacterized protein n=1 Tax=Dreissena polymorpha TaxID=45954 RepID=A0A9D3YWL8_DREPO|nr:hypothetical protein DPMN_068163 [Dreissena polymorpha]
MATVRQYDGDNAIERWRHFDDTTATVRYDHRIVAPILESSFQVDDVVFDRLDNELFGLVKDAYISKLLDMSENNDSTLPQYRQDLSRRARLCEHCPTGILNERRGANRSKRYAEDCYLLQQFLDGNVTNVDDLYRS